MKKVFLSKVTILCTLFIFMFSNMLVFAAPVSTKVSLSGSAKKAPILDINKSYELPVKEGDNLWFKINVNSIGKDKSHITIDVNGSYSTISMFQNLEKAEAVATHSDYLMKEKSLSYPIAWNSKEYYVMVYALETGTLKLNIKDEIKAPELYNRTIDLCPTEMLSKESKAITKLLPGFRNVRDNLLSSSEVGKEITKVYYELSPKISLALVTNKNLRNALLSEVKNLNAFLNEVVNIGNKGKSNYIIKSQDIESLTKIKDAISKILDKDAKSKLDSLWKRLELDKYTNKELKTFMKEKISSDVGAFTDTQIIVSTVSNVNLTKIKSIINSQLSKYNLPGIIKIEETESLFKKGEKIFLVSIPLGKYSKELETILEKNKIIKSVEENYVFETLGNDVSYKYHWGLENTSQKIPVKDLQGNLSNIQGKKGADINYKSLSSIIKNLKLTNVPIAVIDTGINYELADFEGKVDLSKEFNFVNNTTNVMDDNGHGTHVSGIIGAKANNGYSMTGINQYSTIIPIKALNSYGMGDMLSIAKAIKYSVDSGAKVINMSLGLPINPSQAPYIEEALKYANDKNVTVVAATGNDSKGNLSYPASSQYTVAVGALNNEDKKTAFSNYGKDIDIVAPGESVPSLLENGQVTYASGTSMSAPNVAAAVGMIYSVDSKVTNKKVRDILHKTSRDLGKKGYDNEYGYGCLDLSAAVNKAIKEKVK